MTQKSQIQGTNIQLRSNTKVDDKYICKDCEKSGKADFLCVMCESRKHTGKIKESFGDPPEYLCIDCYETATAKKWEEAVEELNQIHRYDFD
jgi:hypothetical protein